MSTSPETSPSRSRSNSAVPGFHLNTAACSVTPGIFSWQPLCKPIWSMHNSRPARRAALRGSAPDGSGQKARFHTVLTDSKAAVRCAARFNETPSGRTLKPLKSHPRRGVDGSENRATMGGSLRRKLRSTGKQALRPLPKIFDSVRRILMRTSGWWCESISRRSRKSKKDSKACKCW